MNKRLLGTIASVVSSAVVIFLILRIAVSLGASKGMTKMKMDSEGALFGKAQKSLAQGDEDGAIKDLEALIAKSRDSSQLEASYLALASIYEKRQDLLKAKELYQKAIENFPASNDISRSQEALDNVNIKILFSPIVTEDSFSYEVQKGDTLAKLAKRFNTTIELISKANGLKDSTIKVGKSLKISKATFSMVVDKSQNILTLKAGEDIMKTYRVSTGESFSTPTGAFKIVTKVVDPVWYSTNAVVPAGSPDNILGSRWLGISKPGYGIHGTTDPASIGKQVTAGCVRMTNADAEELYSIVPEGTEVVIVD